MTKKLRKKKRPKKRPVRFEDTHAIIDLGHPFIWPVEIRVLGDCNDGHNPACIYISAGCRFFTYSAAVKHWQRRLEIVTPLLVPRRAAGMLALLRAVPAMLDVYYNGRANVSYLTRWPSA